MEGKTEQALTWSEQVRRSKGGTMRTIILHRFPLPVRSDVPILVPTREAQTVEARSLVTFAHEEHADQFIILEVDQAFFTVVKSLQNTGSIPALFLFCQTFYSYYSSMIVFFCLSLSLDVFCCPAKHERTSSPALPER